MAKYNSKYTTGTSVDTALDAANSAVISIAKISGGDIITNFPTMTENGLFYGASIGKTYSDDTYFQNDARSHYAKIELTKSSKLVVVFDTINTSSSSQTLVLDNDMKVIYAVQEKNIQQSTDGKYKIVVENSKAKYLYVSCKNATTVLSYTCTVAGDISTIYSQIQILEEGNTTKKINFDSDNKINGYVVSATGKMADGGGNYYHTQPISVIKGQTVKINARGYNTAVAMIAQVLSTDYKTLVTSIDSTNRDYTYIVTEDCDIIVCYDARADVNGNVYIDVPTAIASHSETSKIVNVGATRTITTIKDAVDAANEIALSGYKVDILIDKGTYNAFEGIDLATEGSTFVGLLLEDNVNIIGNGGANEVIINGALPKDMSEYSYQRNNVAIFNSWRNNSYKNITINATNMRYCIHNDWSPNSQHTDDAYELYDSIILNSYQDSDVDTKAAAWPIGSAACNGRVTEFRHCIFNNAANTDHCVNIHNRRNSTKPCKWIFQSCNLIGGKNGALYVGSEGTGHRDIVSLCGCKIPNAITFYPLSGYTGDNEMNMLGYGNSLNGFSYRDGITDGSGKDMLIL